MLTSVEMEVMSTIVGDSTSLEASPSGSSTETGGLRVRCLDVLLLHSKIQDGISV